MTKIGRAGALATALASAAHRGPFAAHDFAHVVAAITLSRRVSRSTAALAATGTALAAMPGVVAVGILASAHLFNPHKA
ncbi:MAG TPA: hypothetical protein VGI22_19125 [Xanthobacteraceae bacterium]